LEAQLSTNHAKAKLFLLVFILSLAFVSCQGKKDEGPLEIVYWTHEDASRTKLEERLIAEFEEMNPDIRVLRKTFSSTDIDEVALTSFEAGKGPSVCTQPVGNVSSLISGGYIAPIRFESVSARNRQELEHQYILGSLDAGAKDGIIYALPLEYTNWALYINKNIMRELGIAEKDYPETLEELYALSKRFVRHEDGAITYRLFDFRYPYYLTFLMPMVNQLGGGILTRDDGTVLLYGEEAWQKVLTFMADWGPFGDNLGSPTYINARSLFNKEKIAMCMSGLYQEKRLEEQNPEFYRSGEWMVIPFPRFSGALNDVPLNAYEHSFVVNAEQSDELISACWRFVDFLQSHALDYLEEVGILMPRVEIRNSPVLEAFPYSQVFLSELSKAVLIEHGLHEAEISSLLAEAVDGLMVEGKSPESVLEQLKVSLSEIGV
jgi:ABC-type sugar transport system, periplasmic component